jgi:hypothetical protein
MSISKIHSLPTTPAYNRRKSPRIAFHGFLKHALSRRGLNGSRQQYLLQKDDIGIRLADGHEQVDQVGMLVTRMYRQRGYLIPVSELPESNSIRRVTLEACYKNRTVGTLSVNLDASERLSAEELYGAEIGAFRRDGARPCEFTRLAVDAQECGLKALACLFHLGFIFAYRIHHASDLFIEVNPRHALFYRRKLGFVQIGEQRLCPRVDAPAVLLHKSLDVLAEELERLGGMQTPEGKSFYALGLSPAEERELVETIESLLAESGFELDARAVRAGAQPAIEDLARSA